MAKKRGRPASDKTLSIAEHVRLKYNNIQVHKEIYNELRNVTDEYRKKNDMTTRFGMSKMIKILIDNYDQ